MAGTEERALPGPRAPHTSGAHGSLAVDFETSFNDPTLGVALIGADGVLLRVNPTLAAIYARPADQLIGHSAQEFTHPDDRPASDELGREARAGRGLPLSLTKRVIRGDGTTAWVRVTATPIRPERGEPSRFLSTVVDITRQRCAESRLQAALDSSPDAMLLVNADGALVAASGSATELLGSQVVDSIGMSLTNAIHPEDRAAVSSWLGAAMQRPGPDGRCVFRLARPDASWCDVEAQATNLLQDPTVEAVVLVLRDVSARLLEEHRVARLQRLYTMLAEINDRLLEDAPLDELLQTACQLAVSPGGFRMAWVGAVVGTSIVPRATAGAGVEYVGRVQISTLEHLPEGRGPTGTAVRTARPVVCPDILADPRLSPWHPGARRHGYGSSAAVPLVAGGAVVGVLSVYADVTDAFDGESLDLLARLAANVSRSWGYALTRERITGASPAATGDDSYSHVAEAVLAASPVLTLALTERGRITYANHAATHFLGLLPQDLVGQRVDLLSGLDQSGTALRAALFSVTSGARRQAAVTTNVSGPGGTRSYETSFVANRGGVRGTPSVFSYTTDVTSLTQSGERLATAAFVDPVTGLPNRAAALEWMQRALQALAPGHAVTVLLVDIERFTVVNETAGEAVGDAVLHAIGARLRSLVRATDMVARLESDEFIVARVCAEQACNMPAVAEDVLEVFTLPIAAAGNEFMLNVCLGAAASASAQEPALALLGRASLALHQAMRAPDRRFVTFDRELAATVSRQAVVAAELTGALERHELTVVYQPVVELGHDHVVGAEALLRWSNPRLGQVPPTEFIPVAEASGQITSLGRFVIRESVRSLQSWAGKPDGLAHVAVNVSQRQLVDEGFAAVVSSLLRGSGIPADSFRLEITESALATDMPRAVRTLSELHDLGVKIAIDDFGTGYSSFAQLRRLPVDVLKVDRSFVEGLPHSAQDLAVVTAIVRMAEALAIDVVAEGVETPEQRELLLNVGCRYGQGFLWSPGVSADDVLAVATRLLVDGAAGAAPRPT